MEVPTSRRARERRLRREAILAAARAEFAEKGFGRAKLDDIARRAEFGKGTLYNYFEGGKEGMLLAIFDAFYDDMEQLVEASFRPVREKEKTFRQGLYDYTLSCLTFYLHDKELFLILVKEAHRMCFGEHEEHACYFRKQQERVVNALTMPIQLAIDAGHVRPIDAKAAAHMIQGNIQGLQVHLLLADGLDRASSPESAAGFLTHLLMDGLSL
ncbi:MAG: TetR/AcrR family transcriptional regulator [Rhodothermales bacterium]